MLNLNISTQKTFNRTTILECFFFHVFVGPLISICRLFFARHVFLLRSKSLTGVDVFAARKRLINDSKLCFRVGDFRTEQIVSQKKMHKFVAILKFVIAFTFTRFMRQFHS